MNTQSHMGSYRGNYTEYDGSHPAVIRAPIGTPVVSIANGVVVKVKIQKQWETENM